MAKFKPNDIAPIAASWTSDELREAIALLSSMLDAAESEPQPDVNDGNGNDAALEPTPTRGKRSDGYIEIKPIKGKLYQYRRYRENGRLKSEYIGPVGSDES